jgi:carbon-monoxide dehydrogenase small subunit
MSTNVNFRLNGEYKSVEVDPNRRLLNLLRDDLNLTGTKEGCGVGECGACTVLLDGRAVNSCLVLCGQLEGAEIITVEGLLEGSCLNPLQHQFLQEGAIQCGFCTSGMLMSAYGLLLHNPSPTEEEIKLAIAGNLCRCTGYKQIIKAIRAAAKDMSCRHNTSSRQGTERRTDKLQWTPNQQRYSTDKGRS